MPRRKALGVHIFAGGFTLGVKTVFDVRQQFEDGKFGGATMAVNQPDVEVVNAFAQWKDHYAAAREEGVEFVYANPPCAPWSVAGHSWKNKRTIEARWHERDPRTSCVYQTFEVLEGVRPKVWAWESVCPAFTKGRDMIDQLTKRAHDLGYSASYVFLQATDLGVPQRRKRMFVMFHSVEFDWHYPRVETPMTVADAWKSAFGSSFGQSETAEHYPINDAARALLKHVEPGSGLRHGWKQMMAKQGLPYEYNERGHVKGRPAFNTVRVALDKPAPTMIGGAHMYHPHYDRPLTPKEAQVLCTYPPTYEFQGSVGDRHSQMAKAVMPRVGAWLAMNVNRALELGRPTQGKTYYVNHADKRYETLN